MKNTALTQTHEKLGAKMVPFAGYNMPLQYEGLSIEHHAVRNSVGVFDVSHMGEFIISGKVSLDLIQHVTTNDAAKLTPGKIQYSCLPNGKGGIVDDLLVYCMAEDEYMLVVNASNLDKDWDWIKSHNRFGAEMKNISDDTALLAVQGQKAVETLQSLTQIDLAGMKYYTFEKGTFAGMDNVIISATGYTGASGFEIYMPNAAAETVWNAVMEAGAAFDIKPAGLGARDTLRLEKGFCLYGNDIDDNTSPIEAGLGWITKFTKDFIDADLLKRQKEEGTAQKLAGFEMVDKGIPRQGYEIVNADGEVIGRVTSGTMSPSLKKAIGLGYVPTQLSGEGSELFIRVRNKDLKAKVVKLPFLK